MLLVSFSLAQACFIPTSLALPAPSPKAPPSQFEFDAESKKFTVVDAEKNSFAIFNGNEKDGIPAVFGIVKEENGKRELIATREIKSLDDLYVFLDPKDSAFLEVTEKLPGGGFGRLLRYRGSLADGSKVDFEFVYQDHESRILILDYLRERFFQTTLTEGRPDPLSVFPHPFGKELNEDWVAVVAPSLKFVGSKSLLFGAFFPGSHRIYSQSEVRYAEDLWTSRHVRGPPVGGLSR